MRLDAMKLADAIRCMSSVDDTGLMHFGPLDRYARVLHASEEYVDGIFDRAVGILAMEGAVKVIGGSCYDAEALAEYEAREAEEREDWEQYLIDREQAYGFVTEVR